MSDEKVNTSNLKKDCFAIDCVENVYHDFSEGKSRQFKKCPRPDCQEYTQGICEFCITGCHQGHYEGNSNSLEFWSVPINIMCACARLDHKSRAHNLTEVNEKNASINCLMGDILGKTDCNMYYENKNIPNESGMSSINICIHCYEYCYQNVLGEEWVKDKISLELDKEAITDPETRKKEEGARFTVIKRNIIEEAGKKEANKILGGPKNGELFHCECVRHEFNQINTHINEQNFDLFRFMDYMEIRSVKLPGTHKKFNSAQILGVLLNGSTHEGLRFFDIFFQDHVKNKHEPDDKKTGMCGDIKQLNFALRNNFDKLVVTKLKSNNMERSLEFLKMVIFHIYNKNCYYYPNPEFQNCFNIKTLNNLLNPKIDFFDEIVEQKAVLIKCFRKFYLNPKTNLPYQKKLILGLINTTPLHRISFRQSLNQFFEKINIPESEYFRLIQNLYENLNSLIDIKNKNNITLTSPLMHLFTEYIKIVSYLFYYNSDEKDIVKFANIITQINDLVSREVSFDISQSTVELILLAINDHSFAKLLRKSENYTENLEFIYTPGKLQEDILKLSFSEDVFEYNKKSFIWSKDTKSIDGKQINKKIEGIYRNLNLYFSEKDLYIEPLENLFNCTNNYFYEEFRNFDQTESKLVPDLDQFIITNFNSIIDEYYNSKINSGEFISNIKTFLSEDGILINNLQMILNGTSAIPFYNKEYKLKQIVIFKKTFPVICQIIKSLKFNRIFNIHEEKVIGETNEFLEDIVEIFKLIYKILNVVVEKNSFLIPILFNDQNYKFLFVFSYESYDPITCPIFAVWFEHLREKKHKLNLTEWCKYAYYNEMNYPAGEICGLKLIRNALKIATKNSVGQLCIFFIKIMETLKFTLSCTINDAFIEYFDSNQNDQYLESYINAESIYILLCKILCKIPNGYFYLINRDFIFPLDSEPRLTEFTGKLLANFDQLNPSVRINITRMYSRCFLSSPFFCDYYSFKPFLEKEISMMENNESYLLAYTKLENGIEEIKENEEIIKIDSETSEKNIFNFDLLLDNIQNFEYVMKKFPNYFNNEDKDKSLKFSLKYLNVIVVVPIKLMFHKMFVFSEKITNKIKYNAYKIVNLSLQSLRTFAKHVLTNNFFETNNQKKQLLLFFAEKINADWKRYFGNMVKTIENVLKPMCEDPKYEFLDLKRTMKIYQIDILCYFRDNYQPRKHDREHELSIINPVDLYVKKGTKKKNSISQGVVFAKMIDKISDQLHKESYGEITLKEKIKLFKGIFKKKGCDNIFKKLVLTKDSTKPEIIKEQTLSFTDKNAILDFKSKICSKVIYLLKYVREEEVNICYDEDDIKKTEEAKLNSEYQFGLCPLYNQYLKLINKYAELDPHSFQSRVTETINIEDKEIHRKETIPDSNLLINCIVYSVKSRIPFLTKIIFMEFETFNPNNKNPLLIYYKRIIRFLTLLCEDYNKLNAYVVSKIKISQDLTFGQYMHVIQVSIINKLKLYSRQQPLLKQISEKLLSKHQFFNKYFAMYFSLYNEYIQSLVDEALIQSQNKKYYDNFYNTSIDLIKTLSVNDIFEDYIYYFCKYMQTFTLEFDNNGKDIEIKDVLQTLFHFYIKLYDKYVHDRVVGEIPQAKKLLKVLLEKTEVFKKDNLFDIFTRFYIFINNKASKNRNGPCDKLIQNMRLHHEKINKEAHTKSNLKKKEKEKIKEISQSNRHSYLQREIFDFFLGLMRRVEISSFLSSQYLMNKKDKLSKDIEAFNPNGSDGLILMCDLDEMEEFLNLRADSSIKEIFFIIDPNGSEILKEDIHDFLSDVTYRENYTAKLEDLMTHFQYINKMIYVRKNLRKEQDWKIKYLFAIKFKYVEYFSLCMTVLINFMLVFSIYYKPVVGVADPLRHTHGNAFAKSGSEIYYPFYYLIFSISLIHLLILAVFIGALFSLEFYKLKKFKEISESKALSKSPLIITQTYNILSIINSKNLVLFWNFFIGCMAIIRWKFNFLYSLQLFSIVTLFPTMTAALYSVKLKYKELLSTGFIIVILLLFFAIFVVIFYQKEFMNADLNENNCSTLLHCFLSLFYYGIRTGAGLGLITKSRSNPDYWDDFIVEWLFYFLVILIMLNMINGIVVDTFQDLQQKETEQIELKYNSCFICCNKRSEFETNGIRFESHVKYEHNIHDYYQYIYKIYAVINPDEFSSCEKEIYEKIKSGLTDFFPVKKSLSLDRVRNKN